MKNAVIALLAVALVVLGTVLYYQDASLNEQRRAVQELTTRFETTSNTSSLDLQERCAAQARREFTAGGWDKEQLASFTNHTTAN
jgi:uncharacterized protein YxeA